MRSESRLLRETFEFLVVEALEQPQVFVHRDYHSRNLMIVAGALARRHRFPGRPARTRWPTTWRPSSRIATSPGRARGSSSGWRSSATRLRGRAGPAGAALAGESQEQFLRWFDLIGLQRHIKVLGIFARLNSRDGKPGYLADLPRTLEYVREVAAPIRSCAPSAPSSKTGWCRHCPAANARALAAVPA